MVKSVSGNLIRSLLAVSLAAAATLIFQTPARAAAPDCELKVVDAKLTVNGQPAKFDVAKNTFAPGQDSMQLNGDGPAGRQLRYTVQAPEGDYYLGQLILCDQFFDMGEGRYNPLHIYLNDTRLVWATHTMPCRPENAADQTHYQTELRLDKPVRLKPGDTLRLVQTYSSSVLGPMRLYKTAPPPGEFRLRVPDDGRLLSQWVIGELTAPGGRGRRSPRTLRCTIPVCCRTSAGWRRWRRISSRACC